MSQHALLSPSKAERWINCPGSIAFCRDIPSTSSPYADEGTAAHAVAAAWLGDSISPAANQKTHDYIKVYTDAVRNAAEGKVLLVEQSVDIGNWTGEKGGKGTADAIIVDLANAMIEVWDLKFGMGHLVDAERNPQLMLYALGALDLVEALYGPMQKVKMVICQPRRDHTDSCTMSRDDLRTFGKEAREAGSVALGCLKDVEEGRGGGIPLNPSEKACLWCPAKATCPALAKLVQETIFEEFSVADPSAPRVVKPIDNGEVPSKATLTLCSDWITAKLDWIDAGLRAGQERIGWKLVLGKKGNRKWTDEAEVERLLKSLKLKKAQTHEEKMLPLTKIEKLIPKPKWPVFEKFISQSDAQPIAVDAADKREAWSAKLDAEAFENEEEKYNAFV